MTSLSESVDKSTHGVLRAGVHEPTKSVSVPASISLLPGLVYTHTHRQNRCRRYKTTSDHMEAEGETLYHRHERLFPGLQLEHSVGQKVLWHLWVSVSNFQSSVYTSHAILLKTIFPPQQEQSFWFSQHFSIQVKSSVCVRAVLIINAHYFQDFSSNTPDSYSEDACFESYPGCRLFWLRFFVLVLSTGTMVQSPISWWRLKSTTQFAIHTSSPLELKKHWVCDMSLIPAMYSATCKQHKK